MINIKVKIKNAIFLSWVWISKRIIKGYQPDWVPPEQVNFWRYSKDSNQLIPFNLIDHRNSPSKTLGIVIPTYVARDSRENQFIIISRVVEQIYHSRYSSPIYICIAMQWINEAQQQEANERLVRILSKFPDLDNRILCGITMQSRRKLDSLNAVFNKFEAVCKYFGWFDDDIELDKNCVQEMLIALQQEEGKKRIALGAKKIGLKRSDLGSSLVYHLKKFTEPSMNYPHGCAMIVSADVVKNGIPQRFSSDDGFICFELLDEASTNHFHLLKICEKAICMHYVGAGSGENLTRIRRMLISHWIMMATYPEKALVYLRHSLFCGLWPLSDFCKNENLWQASGRWIVKSLFFCIFLLMGIEFLIRGLTGRPLKDFNWGNAKVEKAL